MIPASTTTFTVRTLTESEPGEGRTITATAQVAGTLSSPSGGEVWQAGGGSETVDAVIICDPATIAHTDQLVDDTTGDVWEVSWVRKRIGLGLDHMRLGVNRVTGVVS